MIKIFTDGGSRGNPGLSAVGVVLSDEKGTLVELSVPIGESMTNNEAEYAAIILALEVSHAMGAEHVSIQADSELVVKQMKGEYTCKSESLRPYYLRAMKLAQKFGTFSIKHIPRNENQRADKLANEAMDRYEKYKKSLTT